MKILRISDYIRVVVIISFLVQLFPAVNAFCYPCTEDPAIGQTKNQVAAMCGAAMTREQRIMNVEETDEDGTVTSFITDIDEWIYGSGPDNLVQLFRFENEHLVQIKNVGYGNVNDFTIDTCRNGESLAIGDSFAEAYLKCGEPLAKDGRRTKIVETELPGKIRRTFIPVVEWTYRYGPKLPGYTVTFEDGVATNIRTREFGK